MFILGPVLGLKFRMCFFAPSCILYTFKEFAPWAKFNVCVFSGNDSRKYFIGAGIWVSTSSL